MKPPQEPLDGDAILRVYEKAGQAVGLETLVKGLGPVLEVEFNRLMVEFRDAPPDLATLLNFRASLCQSWHLLTELEQAWKLKRPAIETMQKMFNKGRGAGTR